MKFSIVIPLRKIGDFINESIPYHLKQTYKDFEIIIVSEAKETVKFPRTRILKVGKISPGEKRNFGVKHAKGEIIAFIDDDAYPRKDWLENAAKYFRDKKVTGVAGPGVKPKDAGFKETLSGLVYEIGGVGGMERYKKGSKVKEIDDWPTCNFIVRKKDFQKVKGFDSTYWGGEDTQLCHALTQDLGKKIIYDPEVLVYHHRRKDFKGHLRQSLFWGMWRGFFMKKMPETSFKWFYLVPGLFVIGLVAGAILSFFSANLRAIYFLVLLVYLIYLTYVGLKSKSLKYFIPLMVLTSLTHISYGYGILRGLISKMPTRKTFNPAEKLKVK